jgi:hypothetical protein
LGINVPAKKGNRVLDNFIEDHRDNFVKLTSDILDDAYNQLGASYDREYGGFGSAPKFPTPHKIYFLLRYWDKNRESRALDFVEKTLKNMRMRGIYDHIGFGFHRYSTDRRWLVPHFEKMLNDQALLMNAYTEAYQVTGDDFYKQVVEEIVDYVKRDLTSNLGGYYSAEDADTAAEEEEGKFYLWTVKEIESILTPDECKPFKEFYNIRSRGNFRDEATKEYTGNNILFMTRGLEEFSSEKNQSLEEMRRELDRIRDKLFRTREKRVRPLLDDKILVDWNGLMIAALAKASRALDNSDYSDMAKRAVKFIDKNLLLGDQLLHRYRKGEAAINGFLDDYTFLTWGLLELYETTFETKFLEEALFLNRRLLDDFWDEKIGGFYFTSKEEQELPVMRKEIFDEAIPSGNSVAILNLLKLGRLTGDMDLENKAHKLLKVFSSKIAEMPMAHTQSLVALDFVIGPSYEMVIVGDRENERTTRAQSLLSTRFIPNKVVLLKTCEMVKIPSFLEPYMRKDNKTTIYVCRDYQCESPTTNPVEMMELLDKSSMD